MSWLSVIVGVDIIIAVSLLPIVQQWYAVVITFKLKKLPIQRWAAEGKYDARRHFFKTTLNTGSSENQSTPSKHPHPFSSALHLMPCNCQKQLCHQVTRFCWICCHWISVIFTDDGKYRPQPFPPKQSKHTNPGKPQVWLDLFPWRSDSANLHTLICSIKK